MDHRNGTAEVTHAGAQWCDAASCPLSRNPVKDGTQEAIHLATLRAVTVALGVLGDKWSHLHLYKKVSGHC